MGDAGLELLESGKLRRAENVFLQMLEADPGRLRTHFNPTRVYWRAEQCELALLPARRTLRLTPNERAIWRGGWRIGREAGPIFGI